MNARQVEAAQLARCAAAARQQLAVAHDQREANVFRMAAMVLRSRFPGESASLLRASTQYFADHPGEELRAEEVVRKQWVFSLPRLRDTLTRELEAR